MHESRLDGSLPPVAQVPALRELVADLKALAQPTETAFTALGDILGQSLTLLGGLRQGFDNAMAGLDAEGTAAAEAGMREVLRGCADLTGGIGEAGAFLQELDGRARSALRPLLSLRTIVEEIGALAINAKMQVAQIASGTVDFSVFTVEVGRLHEQAGSIVHRALERLRALELSLQEAHRLNSETVDSSARDLGDAAAHLDKVLRSLADRRRLAREAVAAISEVSRAIAERVGQCIAELQINDTTCQRIEHVWRALDLACEILGPSGAPTGGHACPDGLADPQRASLVAEICRLQALQLEGAERDFTAEVNALTANLRALARSAADIVAEASAVVGAGTRAEGSFAADLRVGAEDAARLLESYVAGQEQLRGLVNGVDGELGTLSGDITLMRSIDEDMRLMGLNATLKCGRLGTAGRALGVVAQELRACSRRTDEVTRPVSQAILEAGATSARLTKAAAAKQDAAAHLSQCLASSLRALEELNETLALDMQALGTDSESVAALLARASDEFAIEADIAGVTRRTAERLLQVVELLGISEKAPEAVHAETLRVLQGRYTMASEREVHGRFTGVLDTPSESDSSVGGAQTVDDFFF